MLTEQRYEIILKLLEERKSITVTELRDTPGCIRVHSAERHHSTGQGRKTDQSISAGR